MPAKLQIQLEVGELQCAVLSGAMAAATMSVQRALFRLEEVNKVVAGSSEIDL